MSLLPVPICFGCSKAAPVSISCSDCSQINCASCFGLQDDDLDSSQARFVSLLTIRVCRKCTAAHAGSSRNSAIEKEVVVAVEPEPTPKEVGVTIESEAEVTIEPEPKEVGINIEPKPKQKEVAIEPEPTEVGINIELKPKEKEVTIEPEPKEVGVTIKQELKEVGITIKPKPNEEVTIASKPKEPEPNEENVPIEPELDPKPTNNKVKQEPCWAHGKEMNLFCLTCEIIICGDCFLAGGAHMRHQIDFLETVFKEKRLETERKLARLEETVGVLQREAIHCANNLSTIQAAEHTVLNEIDAICQEAKMSVDRLTANRKRKLETRAQFPVKKQKLVATLHEMIEQMSPVEFFQKQPEVYKQCDKLIADCNPKGFHTLQFADVGCELVPAYEMQNYTLMNFDGAFAGWPHMLTTSCGTIWNVFLRKKESLFIKVSPNEVEATKHPYKLLVLLPHPSDASKNYSKTFSVHGASKEDEIATIEYIREQGFMRKNNELVVKVGLRPLNAITENRFLKNHCLTLKNTIAELDKQVISGGKDINCKFCIMYFALSMTKTPKKVLEAVHSDALVDNSDRHWCLRVYQFGQTMDETNLKVFVVLRKGTRTKCRYFIELLHDDPKKSVIQCTESSFDTIDAGYGWHCFMERKRLLSDVGYYPGGVLRFRFGIQPLDK